VDIFDSVTNFNTPTNQWISYGSTAFISPQTQAVNPVNGNVYVLDGGSGGAQVVYQFTSTGGLVNHSTTAFNTIQDVETDSAGNAYVVDQGGATLYELNSSMGVVKTWTAAGSTAFSSLFSVALDSSNNIYVCDNGSAPGHNHIWELNAGAGTTVVNTWNTPSGNFIYQMCVNPSGTVYAVDEGVVGLEKYVPGTPTPVTFTGSEGGGTAFSAPDGVCFLPNGDLLVADFSINKLEEYTP
jgi:streptogramin lyase